MRMPERQIPALGLALALGFLEGLIATTLELHGGVLWILAIVGVLVVIGASLLSMLGMPAERNDALLTGLLRGALAAGVFVCIFTALQQLGGSGQVGSFLILMFLAGGLAIASTRVRTRALIPEEARTEDEAREAEKLEEERESESEADSDEDASPREGVRERALSSEGDEDGSSERERDGERESARERETA